MKGLWDGCLMHVLTASCLELGVDCWVLHSVYILSCFESRTCLNALVGGLPPVELWHCFLTQRGREDQRFGHLCPFLCCLSRLPHALELGLHEAAVLNDPGHPGFVRPRKPSRR